jgi:hypothetical protein
MARARVKARERARAAVTETLRGNAVVDLNVASHVPVGTHVVAGGEVAGYCFGANEGAAEIEELLQAHREGIVVRGWESFLSEGDEIEETGTGAESDEEVSSMAWHLVARGPVARGGRRLAGVTVTTTSDEAPTAAERCVLKAGAGEETGLKPAARIAAHIRYTGAAS